jgi:hypothetical protein
MDTVQMAERRLECLPTNQSDKGPEPHLISRGARFNKSVDLLGLSWIQRQENTGGEREHG